MKQPFVALTAVYLLAELVEDEKLKEFVKRIPSYGEWSEVQDLIINKIRQRTQFVVPTEEQGEAFLTVHEKPSVSDALSFLGWEWAD